MNVTSGVSDSFTPGVTFYFKKTHAMKKLFILAAALTGMTACAEKTSLTVKVNNPLDADRNGEMVELSMSEISTRLNLADTAQIVVLDGDGKEVPYQVTYDNLLIFPTAVKAGAQTEYTIQPGVPAEVGVQVCGRHYPQRLDDLAWENDLVGFRAYGPALQDSGQRGYGYDLFTKRGTTEPVLEDELYAGEFNPEFKDNINRLRKEDPEAARELTKKYSYHVDHGYGMDCYAVGPTLGPGTNALMIGDTIVYPWCYKEYEILDNGPLRFTARLTFRPAVVGSDSAVVETRVITLDKGSHLNRTVVSYDNLTRSLPVAAGIVLHDDKGVVRAEAGKGYITYEDPTTGPNQGTIYVGCVFPTNLDKAVEVRFDADEKKRRNNAGGHVLAIASYEPGAEFTYYWGFGWNRSDIKDEAAWQQYIERYAAQVRTPLEVAF